MTISVIHAKSSMSVIPGSDTLCSVQSGHRSAIRVRASLTSSWKPRSSRLMSGSLTAVPWSSSAPSFLLWDHVEGVDEVANVVRRAEPVGDVDAKLAQVRPIDVELDVEHLDARLPPVEGHPHLVVQAPERVGVDRLEDVVVDAAAELRAHRPLSGGRAEDDGDGLLDVLVVPDQRQPSSSVDAQWEGHPA